MIKFKSTIGLDTYKLDRYSLYSTYRTNRVQEAQGLPALPPPLSPPLPHLQLHLLPLLHTQIPHLLIPLILPLHRLLPPFPLLGIDLLRFISYMTVHSPHSPLFLLLSIERHEMPLFISE